MGGKPGAGLSSRPASGRVSTTTRLEEERYSASKIFGREQLSPDSNRTTGWQRTAGREAIPASRVAIVTKLSAFQSFVDPDVSPDKRRRAFKTWPWWQHYVEALYRGEHALAKDRGTRSASIEAEESVGRTLGISASTVHTICGGIRRMRKADEGSAKFSDHDAG
jgi:hypothetical protein